VSELNFWFRVDPIASVPASQPPPKTNLILFSTQSSFLVLVFSRPTLRNYTSSGFRKFVIQPVQWGRHGTNFFTRAPLGECSSFGIPQSVKSKTRNEFQLKTVQHDSASGCTVHTGIEHNLHLFQISNSISIFNPFCESID